ncbi:MFS transporter [Candidatus Odyssella thessalonicensis]|uniref:MFS transporter n=1 Tax=Candidatus Odyssella thessalonicensis TaxID=84647 RepID=UPI000225B93D|nr:MFS transporter [Candidatus Odyssella thessalonicensis]
MTLTPKHIAWLIFSLNIILISSIDIYIPAAPYLAKLFGVEDSIMKLTFLVNPFLSSIMGIPFGRYSDRIGRRPFVMVGIGMYIIGALLCTIAPGIEVFFAGRCLQAMGTGGLSVLSGALLADIFAGATLARYMGILASLYPIVFALAPILGAEILTYLGWRYIFATNLIAMILMAMIIWPSLPETNDKAKVAAAPTQGVAGMRMLLMSGTALILVMIHALPICFNGIFTVNSPFIYIDTFLFTPTQYAYIQAVPVSLQFIGALTYKSIVERLGLATCLKVGLMTTLAFIIAAGLMMIGVIKEDPYLIIGIISTFSFGSTFMISSAATLILDMNPGNKGLTMSYIALMRNLALSLIVGLLSSTHYDSISPVIGFMVLSAVAASVLVRLQLRMMKR